MARKRQFAFSRLSLAWISLVSTLIIGAFLVLIVPTPQEVDHGVTIELPEQTDRFAATDPSFDDVPISYIQDNAPQENTNVTGTEGANELKISAEPVNPDPASKPIQLSLGEEPASNPDGPVIITIPGASSSVDVEGNLGPGSLNPALVAQSSDGMRPKIGNSGETPFEAYRRKIGAQTDRKPVSIIVSGLGIDTNLTEKALEALPPEVTLSFVPYTRNLPALIERANQKGHEVIIEVPMESPGVDTSALGPAALSTQRSFEANSKRLDWIMSRAPAYPMITNYLGTGFSKDPVSIAPVLQAAKNAGVAYIDDTGNAAEIAAQIGVRYAPVDEVVPQGAANAGIRLDQMAARASATSVPLAKVFAADGSLDAVLAWANNAPSRGLVLVPASEAVEARP